jgi:hypothetical protein
MIAVLLIAQCAVLLLTAVAIITSLSDSALGTAMILQRFYAYAVVPLGILAAMALLWLSFARKSVRHVVGVSTSSLLLVTSGFLAANIDLGMAWKFALPAMLGVVLINTWLCLTPFRKGGGSR